MEVRIPFTEMTAEELFVVLTGGDGIIAQVNLQEIVEEYKEKYGEITDLVTMVHKMADDTKYGRF